MIVGHDDRRLAQAKGYLVGFIFCRHTERLHLSGDILLAGQPVYRCRGTYSATDSHLRERDEALNNIQRYVVQLYIGAQSMLVGKRRREKDIYRMVTQLHIAISEAVEGKSPVAMQGVSYPLYLHAERRIGTKVVDIHHAIGEARVRQERGGGMSFRNKYVQRRISRRETKRGSIIWMFYIRRRS